MVARRESGWTDVSPGRSTPGGAAALRGRARRRAPPAGARSLRRSGSRKGRPMRIVQRRAVAVPVVPSVGASVASISIEMPSSSRPRTTSRDGTSRAATSAAKVPGRPAATCSTTRLSPRAIGARARAANGGDATRDQPRGPCFDVRDPREHRLGRALDRRVDSHLDRHQGTSTGRRRNVGPRPSRSAGVP